MTPTVGPPIASTLPAYRVVRSTMATRLAMVAGLVLFVAFASLPSWGTSGLMKLLVEFFTILAMAQMWNLLAGYGGLLSLGHQLFIGIGAYALFDFTQRTGLSPYLVLPVTGVLGALAAMVVAPA